MDGPSASSAQLRPDASSAEVEVVPFELSGELRLTVPAHRGTGRLLLWLTDAGGTTVARAFLDAAPVEEPNRRGARTAG
ncbi:hypothetical protein [Leifsonia aquatica]|uniref:hypothetical protein n=1 Tax=Leifsonia aquatica TaxID=144185 RepID=UPI0028AEEA4C|nr:hypothetical protein [Leifsonia aquatica]